MSETSKYIASLQDVIENHKLYGGILTTADEKGNVVVLCSGLDSDEARKMLCMAIADNENQNGTMPNAEPGPRK